MIPRIITPGDKIAHPLGRIDTPIFVPQWGEDANPRSDYVSEWKDLDLEIFRTPLPFSLCVPPPLYMYSLGWRRLGATP